MLVTNQPVIAIFPETVKSADDPLAKVVYELGGSEYRTLFAVHDDGSIHLRQALDVEVPSIIELQIKVRLLLSKRGVVTVDSRPTESASQRTSQLQSYGLRT